METHLGRDNKMEVFKTKPFEINPECDKCGKHNAELKFFSNEGGWLEVTCNVCGYSWDMETSDTKREKETPRIVIHYNSSDLRRAIEAKWEIIVEKLLDVFENERKRRE